MTRHTRKIQSLERAMVLLETIVAAGGHARLQALVEASGLSTSTVHGLLDTLVSLGYVSRENNRYTVGSRMETLTAPAKRASDNLRTLFAPALSACNEISGQRCVLAIVSGTRTYLTIDGLDIDRHPIDITPPESSRDALITSAAGKVLIAHDANLARRLRREGGLPHDLEAELGHVNARGYAFDLQASQIGLNCLALPLRYRGRVVAALGISGPVDGFGASRMRKLASSTTRKLFDLVKC